MRGQSTLFIALALFGGLVAGFVLGGLGPRREVSELEEDIAALNLRLEQRSSSGRFRSAIPGFDRILRDPEPELSEEPRAPAGADEVPRPEPGSPGEPEREVVRGNEAQYDPDAGPADMQERPRSLRERWERRSPEERVERAMDGFDRAASVQGVRRVQSRAALIEQAQLSPEETEAVDGILSRMNEQLYGHGEELIQLTFGETPPAPRDLLGLTHDVTGIMRDAQVELEETVGPERMGEVDPSALEIWNHVAVEPLREAAEAAAGAAEPADE